MVFERVVGEETSEVGDAADASLEKGLLVRGVRRSKR